MDILDGMRRRIALAMASNNPWGKRPDDDGPGDGGDTPRGDKPSKPGGPKNPWLPGNGNGSGGKRGATIEDIFKNRGPEGPRRRVGGPGSGGGPGGGKFQLPPRPGGKSWWPVVAVLLVSLWLLLSSFHIIGAKERGVVTTLGSYSHTMQPGFNLSLPWPLQSVDVEPVSTIRVERIPDGQSQKLILTGDQNLVDLSYLVRWNIKDLKNFKFQLADPIETVQEVAEQAMRAEVARKSLDQVFSGQGRADIELRVRDRMQALLDAYQSGVAVQGVEIEKTDPPEAVDAAFKDVSVAEQDANAAVNRAQGVAQQILERARGETGAFDRVYAEYRRAPEVTRRRLYYETMERVLRNTDKTIVEADGVTPYLPLPEIQRRSRENAQVTAPAAEGQ